LANGPRDLSKFIINTGGEAIPFLVRICYGKAVDDPDIGADDRVTWWAQELDSAGEEGRNSYYCLEGLMPVHGANGSQHGIGNGKTLSDLKCSYL
jgi:hypothetical protein